ncbi:remorin [Artemisia annua]|uniref:Remorin n=1 Tax=Artemisia annua TaxID=35608 RepID=A0A2U1N041_ARTAN|nr:remorin [Artemisia annua]
MVIDCGNLVMSDYRREKADVTGDDPGNHNSVYNSMKDFKGCFGTVLPPIAFTRLYGNRHMSMNYYQNCSPRLFFSCYSAYGSHINPKTHKEKVVNRNPIQNSKLSSLETRPLALDQAECAKYMAKFKQEEVKIQARENHEKRTAELEIKRIEFDISCLLIMRYERPSQRPRRQPSHPLLHRPPLQASDTLPGGGSSMPDHRPSVTPHFSASPNVNTFETDVNKSRNSGSTRVKRVAQQQLPSSHSYSHSGEGSVQRCIATTVTQISPEPAVFPPQEGPTLNVNQVLHLLRWTALKIVFMTPQIYYAQMIMLQHCLALFFLMNSHRIMSDNAAFCYTTRNRRSGRYETIRHCKFRSHVTHRRNKLQQSTPQFHLTLLRGSKPASPHSREIDICKSSVDPNRTVQFVFTLIKPGDYQDQVKPAVLCHQRTFEVLSNEDLKHNLCYSYLNPLDVSELDGV